MVRGPRAKHQGPWSTDLEPRVVESVSRFKLLGSRLVETELGLLGLVARSGSNWGLGVEPMLGLGRASDLGLGDGRRL